MQLAIVTESCEYDDEEPSRSINGSSRRTLLHEVSCWLVG